MEELKIVLELETENGDFLYYCGYYKDNKPVISHNIFEAVSFLTVDQAHIACKNVGLDFQVKEHIFSDEYADDDDCYEKEESYRGCCSECGEGYDNEVEWKYNTECELCGHPIPEHLIIKKD